MPRPIKASGKRSSVLVFSTSTSSHLNPPQIDRTPSIIYNMSAHTCSGGHHDRAIGPSEAAMATQELIQGVSQYHPIASRYATCLGAKASLRAAIDTIASSHPGDARDDASQYFTELLRHTDACTTSWEHLFHAAQQRVDRTLRRATDADPRFGNLLKELSGYLGWSSMNQNDLTIPDIHISQIIPKSDMESIKAIVDRRQEIISHADRTSANRDGQDTTEFDAAAELAKRQSRWRLDRARAYAHFQDPRLPGVAVFFDGMSAEQEHLTTDTPVSDLDLASRVPIPADEDEDDEDKSSSTSRAEQA